MLELNSFTPKQKVAIMRLSQRLREKVELDLKDPQPAYAWSHKVVIEDKKTRGDIETIHLETLQLSAEALYSTIRNRQEQQASSGQPRRTIQLADAQLAIVSHHDLSTSNEAFRMLQPKSSGVYERRVIDLSMTHPIKGARQGHWLLDMTLVDPRTIYVDEISGEIRPSLEVFQLGKLAFGDVFSYESSVEPNEKFEQIRDGLIIAYDAVGKLQ